MWLPSLMLEGLHSLHSVGPVSLGAGGMFRGKPQPILRLCSIEENPEREPYTSRSLH
jgi:hypothetical protein